MKDEKRIHLNIADFVDNESFEEMLCALGVTRGPENSIQSITLTIKRFEASYE